MTEFSVILPFRNAAATLQSTLDSLLAQDMPRWEALLVDDGSDDGSAAIAARMAGTDPRLRLMTQGAAAARGVARTRNIGIAASSGRFIAFLDADDRWLPQKLSRQISGFADAPIVFSSYRRVDVAGRTLGVVQAQPRVVWRDALAGNPIGCLTGAYDTRVFGRARMPEIPMHEDYAFWLALLKTGAVAKGLPDVLAEYRVSTGSASGRKGRAAVAVWNILGTQGLSPLARAAGMAGYVASSLRRRL